ncbi:MAG: hypothetical protein J6X28_04145 [Bacilli bacterium]|nr:hypothetical protein [Bacilli bacterium]
MRKWNVKNIIIVLLCITIIAMGIGFSVLSMTLEGYKNEEEVFDVRFTTVRLLSSIKGGEREPIGHLKVDDTGKVLNMDFSLFKEHDEIDYEVTIKNEGTVEASVVRLLSSPDFRSKEIIKEISPITISISDISGKVLEPGEETTIKISAIYNPGEIPSEKTKFDLSGKIGIIAESKK